MQTTRMDKQRKKELRRRWREGQRAETRAALPLPFDELKAMFDMLDTELSRHSCDRTRRLTRRWLEVHGHDADPVFAWLDQLGGFCDCEVLVKIEQHVEDAMHEE
jgi:hypothetical protein